ncbi:ankyrin repeat domain-containing protein [Sorangium sp. So ce1128]
MEAIFEAVLQNAKEVARLLRTAPDSCRARMSQDHLVEEIPHWLYVGDTSLHLAAAALRLDEARLLLRAGADPNAENRRGATPLHYACDPRPRSAVPWSRESQTGLIRLLVEYGADLERADRGGATALHRAVRARSPGAVGQLLALGAQPNCRLGKRGSSPLHLAAQSTGAGGTVGSMDEQLDIIRLLLQRGADPTATDAADRTPRDGARNERVLAALGADAKPPARAHGQPAQNSPKARRRRPTRR